MTTDPVKKAQKVRLYKPGSTEFELFNPANARDMRRMGWSDQPNSGPVAEVRVSEQATKILDGVTYHPVWSPEGRKEYHTSVNKRDLVTHMGWKEYPPKPATEKLDEPAPVPEPVKVMDTVEVPGPDGPITVPDPTKSDAGMSAEEVLNDLHERARVVGLRTDRRWSVASLEQKVQEAEAEKAASEKLAAETATNEAENAPPVDPAPPAPQDTTA